MPAALVLRNPRASFVLLTVKNRRIDRLDDLRLRVRQDSRRVVNRLSADTDRAASGVAGISHIQVR